MSVANSDFNKNGTTPLNVAQAPLYSDLDLRLGVIGKKNGGGSGDITPLTDLDAVKNAVKNLVLSNYHDRPHQPFLGSNVRALLFENANDLTAQSIQSEILRVLLDHEPRVGSVNVVVVDNSDTNEYRVTIEFMIVSLNRRGRISFYLERLR